MNYGCLHLVVSNIYIFLQVFMPLLSFGQIKAGEILSSVAPTPQVDQAGDTSTPQPAQQ